MADKKERELTGKELKGITGGKAAQPNLRRPDHSVSDHAEPKPTHRIDPDPKVPKPFGTSKGGGKR